MSYNNVCESGSWLTTRKQKTAKNQNLFKLPANKSNLTPIMSKVKAKAALF